MDTTRAYALQSRVDDAEFSDMGVRHATYYRQGLEQTGAEWPTLSNAAERAPHLAALGNMRVALEWCFGPGGDTGIGIALASTAAPVFLAMFLAEMLGVSRRAVSMVARTLQRAGLIRYSRGMITVEDRARLEAASCECYDAIRQQYEDGLFRVLVQNGHGPIGKGGQVTS